MILEAHCLWHSNWTICSLLSQFCSEIFPPFYLDTWVSVPMAFILDHLQPVEPAFRELENHFLGTGNQSFGSCTSIPLLNFFPRIQTLLSFSGHREVIFRELESHFLGTKKSFSGNLKETLLSFLGCREVIFWEQESHFLGT